MKANFRIGQEVTWTGGANGRPLRCKVVRVMPADDTVQTYRVQGLAERFERSVSEETLTKIGQSERERIFST